MEEKNKIYMKQFFYTLIVGLYSVQAQGQTLRFNAGVAHTSLDFNFLFDNGRQEDQYNAPLIGYSFGGELAYLNKGIYSMSSEVAISKIGGKYSREDAQQGFIVRVADKTYSSYVSLSTLIHFNPVHGKTRLELGIGPRMDIQIGNKETFVVGAGKLTKINAGFTARAGVYHSIGQLELGLKVSYLNRLKKIASYEATPFSGTIKTQGFLIKLF